MVICKFFGADKKQSCDWLAEELTDSVVRKLKAYFDLDHSDPHAERLFESHLARTRGGGVGKSQIASLARRARADVVVVGRFDCTGDTVRVDVQGMRPSSDAISAPLHFESSTDRIWSLEAEMAESIAGLLGRRLSERERARLAECPTFSGAAFEELCKGRQAPEGSYSKIQHFQKAIAADPGCVEAHYLLGNAYCGIGMTYRYTEWFNMALDEYRRAADIAPNSSKIYCAMGVACMMNGRYDCARKSFEKALEIDPGMKAARGSLRRIESMGL